MGTVLDLEQWRPTSGDWTSLERSQLYALTERLPADPGRDIVMGVTDAGDPWFVVLNGQDEVELHVARIGGRFVLHAGDESQVAEAPDVWTAAQRLGGFGLPDRTATVTALFGDTLPLHAIAALEAQRSALESSSEPAEPTRPPARAAGFADLSAVDSARLENSELPDFDLPAFDPAEAPRHRAMLADTSRPPPVVELSSTPPDAAFVFGTPLVELPTEFDLAERPALSAEGGETLSGTDGPDTLAGGAGEDFIDGGGAGPGEVDLLDGGGGDDRIVLGPNVVAIGGRGSDGFLVVSPNSGLVASNFGIVMDFFQSRADRLEFAPGARVRVVEASPESDILAPVRGQAQFQDAPTLPGLRLALDVNGDGKADGYVLLGNANAAAGSGGARTEAPPSAPPPSLLVPPGGFEPAFNTTANLVGLEARPAGGHNMVLTAYQVGPNYFPDTPPPGASPLPGLLRPEDVAPAPVEMFG